MPIRTSVLTPDYLWNEVASRYINRLTGRFVKSLDVRNALDQVAETSRQNIRSISEQLQRREISLAEWQTGMAREIKALHTASAAAARGGWAQMSQADWGATGQLVRRQYEYLQNFANEIASGRQPLNGRFLVRADMYGEAGRGTYEQMRRRVMRGRGAQEEKRVLGQSEHCPGCLEQANLGWQPLGTLDPIGAEECRTRCHCHFAYRVDQGDGVYQYFET